MAAGHALQAVIRCAQYFYPAFITINLGKDSVIWFSSLSGLTILLQAAHALSELPFSFFKDVRVSGACCRQQKWRAGRFLGPVFLLVSLLVSKFMLESRGGFFFLDYLNSAEQTLNLVHWVRIFLTISPSCATGWVLHQPGFNQGPHVVCLVPGLSQRRFELGKVWIQPRNSPKSSSRWCDSA